jgi:TolB-like protein
VSEAALSSRINAARKAIGDNGNDQNFIRTLHKRGFRFIGEVKEVADQSSPLGAVSVGEADLGKMLTHSVRREEPWGHTEESSARGKPRVAVLPFANLGQDPDHDYFGYGLTEDIIRLLGRARWLDILTRHSTYAFRGRGVDPREVGATLGVRYLVQGSFRKRGERVRITAELIESTSGRQFWSEVYDLDLVDIFDIQDAMAQQIAAMIEPELGSIERQIAARKPPESLDAWDCYQCGYWHLWGFTTPGFEKAETWFRRAVEIEPGLARAHAALSYVHLQRAFYCDPKDRPGLLISALALARTAVSLDERDCLCHCVLGRVHCLLRNHDEAIAELERTIELNPSFAQGYFALAFTLVWCGREEETIALIERAAELSPTDPHLWTFHHTRALAHLSLDELESTEVFSRKAIRQPNATYFPYVTLVAALGLMHRTEEAKIALQELSAKKPGYNLSVAEDSFFYCANDRLLDRYMKGLRQAGVTT